MIKKKESLILVLVMVVTLLVPHLVVNAAVPEGYRKLMDIQIFKGSTADGWTGSGAAGEIETVNATLPVDKEVVYNELPTLKLNVEKQVSSGWWVSLLTVRGWNTHNFTQYFANGYLEFDVKGKEGGETFFVGFRDKVFERNFLEINIKNHITEYTEITTEWQHVKIPLNELITTATGFDPASVMCLVIEKAHTNPFTVWFSDIKVTSPDSEESAPAIKVNQVGFLPDSEKYALVTGFGEELTAEEGTSFSVVNANDESVAYDGELSLVSEFEAVDSGEKILKADFSSLKTPGEYYIKVDATDMEDSLKFKIGQDIYNSLVVDASRYFYYQRQGIEIESTFASDYPREDITPQDTEAVFASGDKTPIDVTKGWYDAGDFGKYINAGATGISDLFWAYEMFPEQFTDNQFNIPESGNGIADILDECRWELEWILKMQDSESGGFYPRVQSDDDEKITKRIIKDQNGCTTDDTACAAAILAHAYIMYKDIDADFAAECLDSAKRAWTFLEENPNNIISPSGPYNVTSDKSDRLWASASLFRATGDDIYDTYFKQNTTEFSKNTYAHTWGDMWLTAYLTYLKAENKDAQTVSFIDAEFDKWLNKILTRYEDNPWKNTIAPGNYFWGINMQIMNVPMDAYIGAQLLGKDTDEVKKLGLGSLNWLLGTNPLRFSFVSGYGEDSADVVFSNIYNFDEKPGIPNGYMPGGPNSIEGSELSRFAAKCYTRSSGDWVANEHTVYWNSALVFMSAFANNNNVSTNPSVSYGDLNNNGKIESTDYSILLRYILDINKDINVEAADLNCDGLVNSTDVQILRRYLLKIITELPYK